MLQLYSDNGERLATLSGYQSLKITKTLASGEKELSFSVSAENQYAAFLQNEYYVRTKEDEYVIKDVAEGQNESIAVIAMLNLEALEGKSFLSFKTTEMTVDDCLSQALDGTGWTIGICEITKKRTIKKDAPCHALDIVNQCISTYACEIAYDTIGKKIHLYEHIGADRGAYFIESLNLRKCKLRRTSYDFFTRLIPIGKNGIGIDLNGKNYVEDYSYSHKVKTCIWKDERYTNAEHLAEDGARKLAELAKPYRVYTTEIIDLAGASAEYDILAYELGDTVTLISKKTDTKEKMRIVKTVTYPGAEQKNTCELSNTKKSFADIQEEKFSAIVAEAVAASKEE